MNQHKMPLDCYSTTLSLCPECLRMLEIDVFGEFVHCPDCRLKFKNRRECLKDADVRRLNVKHFLTKMSRCSRSDQLLECIQFTANTAFGTNEDGIIKVLIMWANHIRHGSLRQRIHACKVLWNSLCLAELDRIQQREASISVKTRIKRLGAAQAAKIVRQLVLEGFFTLDQIDPPPPREIRLHAHLASAKSHQSA